MRAPAVPRVGERVVGTTGGTAACWTEAIAACCLGTAAEASAAEGTASSVAAVDSAASLFGETGASTVGTASAFAAAAGTETAASSAVAAGREIAGGVSTSAGGWTLSCPALPSWPPPGGSWTTGRRGRAS